ncbi:MAG: hypothetical protein Kow00121_17740 [Elainellaceae cyanobacterium]
MNQYPDEQLSLDELYALGLKVRPPYATGFLEIKYQRSRGYQLLGQMRDLAKRVQRGQIKPEESYKSKAQLAELAFPREWADIDNKTEFERIGGQVINLRRVYQKHFIDKTGEVMRLIAREMRGRLKNCKSDKERLLFISNSLEMFVRVGLTDNEEFLFSYHGPDVRQSSEILRVNWELMQVHSVKQDADRRLAELVYVAETRPLQTEMPIKLDPDFKPQDDLDITGEDSNGTEEYDR